MSDNKSLKILIIRFSSIGDIVLTSPVIRCLKLQTDAEIHYLVKPQYYTTIKANPYIDKIHQLNPNLKDTFHELKQENFDLIIDLHHNLRSLRIKKALKGIKAYSFYKMNIEKWLIVNLGIDLLQKRHIVDRYMDTVSSLGVTNDNKGLDYHIPETDRVEINTLPLAFQKGFVAIAIGGNHLYKKLPNQKLIDICKKLNKPIVLLGGKEDAGNGQIISVAAGANVINTCGQYTINQSASIVQQADAIITHDTGLMHIAAAFKQKIISIWGATIPQFGMSPYLPGNGSVLIEPKGGSIRPYSKLGNHKWYKGRFTGMDFIDVDEVVNAVLN